MSIVMASKIPNCRDTRYVHEATVRVQITRRGQEPIEFYACADHYTIPASSAIKTRLLTVMSSVLRSWICSACGERNPESFTKCGNCHKVRDRKDNAA